MGSFAKLHVNGHDGGNLNGLRNTYPHCNNNYDYATFSLSILCTLYTQGLQSPRKRSEQQISIRCRSLWNPGINFESHGSSEAMAMPFRALGSTEPWLPGHCESQDSGSGTVRDVRHKPQCPGCWGFRSSGNPGTSKGIGMLFIITPPA
jgi:hypothetical protein